MQVIAVRLTAEEITALDALAERDNVSRSEAIRRALAGTPREGTPQRRQARGPARGCGAGRRLVPVD
ncbi:ribbon-helix-helix protein, CopG family [Tessaracoccus sp. MC1679]|uniref:ribbon-helix-helix protein, CopG family n=1 Tax=Tessaracoccus sp. MC1679 TaxID=2760313 RepID=UPI00351C80DD